MYVSIDFVGTFSCDILGDFCLREFDIGFSLFKERRFSIRFFFFPLFPHRFRSPAIWSRNSGADANFNTFRYFFIISSSFSSFTLFLSASPRPCPTSFGSVRTVALFHSFFDSMKRPPCALFRRVSQNATLSLFRDKVAF